MKGLESTVDMLDVKKQQRSGTVLYISVMMGVWESVSLYTAYPLLVTEKPKQIPAFFGYKASLVGINIS